MSFNPRFGGGGGFGRGGFRGGGGGGFGRGVFRGGGGGFQPMGRFPRPAGGRGGFGGPRGQGGPGGFGFRPRGPRPMRPQIPPPDQPKEEDPKKKLVKQEEGEPPIKRDKKEDIKEPGSSTPDRVTVKDEPNTPSAGTGAPAKPQTPSTPAEKPKPPEPLATSTPTTQVETLSKPSGITPLMDFKPMETDEATTTPPWKRKRDDQNNKTPAKAPTPQSEGKKGPLGRPLRNPEIDVDETQTEDPTAVILDEYNSDLHLKLSKDGHSAEALAHPLGFCFVWSGGRATYGVTGGKVCYEVLIKQHLPIDFGDDHKEDHPHVIRVGWSLDSTSFQLGEEPMSYGYGGTGRFSTNNKFSVYGEEFTEGDVLLAMVDLEARPPNISYAKNGRWLGVAIPLHRWPVGVKDKALFPHILSKNCSFEVNFGQRDPWFPPPPSFTYIGDVPLMRRVRGVLPPAKKSDCEMIMMCGLPGVGKTTWAQKYARDHPEKRFNIIGTDTLIDKMKVMGLPRKRNFGGRWETLIQKSTACLNKLFEIAGRRKRNLILDQTNVYPTARKRKMKSFDGFKRRVAVLIPTDEDMVARSIKRTKEEGKEVPETAVIEMKANFRLPDESDPHVDEIFYIELDRESAQPIVDRYNMEGQSKVSKDKIISGRQFGGRGRGMDRGRGGFQSNRGRGGFRPGDRSESPMQQGRPQSSNAPDSNQGSNMDKDQSQSQPFGDKGSGFDQSGGNDGMGRGGMNNRGFGGNRGFGRGGFERGGRRGGRGFGPDRGRRPEHGQGPEGMGREKDDSWGPGNEEFDAAPWKHPTSNNAQPDNRGRGRGRGGRGGRGGFNQPPWMGRQPDDAEDWSGAPPEVKQEPDTGNQEVVKKEKFTEAPRSGSQDRQSNHSNKAPDQPPVQVKDEVTSQGYNQDHRSGKQWGSSRQEEGFMGPQSSGYQRPGQWERESPHPNPSSSTDMHGENPEWDNWGENRETPKDERNSRASFGGANQKSGGIPSLLGDGPVQGENQSYGKPWSNRNEGPNRGRWSAGGPPGDERSGHDSQGPNKPGAPTGRFGQMDSGGPRGRDGGNRFSDQGDRPSRFGSIEDNQPFAGRGQHGESGPDGQSAEEGGAPTPTDTDSRPDNRSRFGQSDGRDNRGRFGGQRDRSREEGHRYGQGGPDGRSSDDKGRHQPNEGDRRQDRGSRLGPRGEDRSRFGPAGSEDKRDDRGGFGRGSPRDRFDSSGPRSRFGDKDRRYEPAGLAGKAGDEKDKFASSGADQSRRAPTEGGYNQRDGNKSYQDYGERKPAYGRNEPSSHDQTGQGHGDADTYGQWSGPGSTSFGPGKGSLLGRPPVLGANENDNQQNKGPGRFNVPPPTGPPPKMDSGGWGKGGPGSYGKGGDSWQGHSTQQDAGPGKNTWQGNSGYGESGLGNKPDRWGEKPMPDFSRPPPGLGARMGSDTTCGDKEDETPSMSWPGLDGDSSEPLQPNRPPPSGQDKYGGPKATEPPKPPASGSRYGQEYVSDYSSGYDTYGKDQSSHSGSDSTKAGNYSWGGSQYDQGQGNKSWGRPSSQQDKPAGQQPSWGAGNPSWATKPPPPPPEDKTPKPAGSDSRSRWDIQSPSKRADARDPYGGYGNHPPPAPPAKSADTRDAYGSWGSQPPPAKPDTKDAYQWGGPPPSKAADNSESYGGYGSQSKPSDRDTYGGYGGHSGGYGGHSGGYGSQPPSKPDNTDSYGGYGGQSGGYGSQPPAKPSENKDAYGGYGNRGPAKPSDGQDSYGGYGAQTKPSDSREVYGGYGGQQSYEKPGDKDNYGKWGSQEPTKTPDTDTSGGWGNQQYDYYSGYASSSNQKQPAAAPTATPPKPNVDYSNYWQGQAEPAAAKPAVESWSTGAKQTATNSSQGRSEAAPQPQQSWVYGPQGWQLTPTPPPTSTQSPAANAVSGYSSAPPPPPLEDDAAKKKPSRWGMEEAAPRPPASSASTTTTAASQSEQSAYDSYGYTASQYEAYNAYYGYDSSYYQSQDTVTKPQEPKPPASATDSYSTAAGYGGSSSASLTASTVAQLASQLSADEVGKAAQAVMEAGLLGATPPSSKPSAPPAAPDASKQSLPDAGTLAHMQSQGLPPPSLIGAPVMTPGIAPTAMPPGYMGYYQPGYGTGASYSYQAR